LSGISSTTWLITPHTKAKHEILRRYLGAWFPILSKHSGRIIYLDGFAGPGVYDGGEDGSPVIALQTAVNHVLSSQLANTQILFFFIEKDQERAKRLEITLKSKFPSLPKNINYIVRGAEFAPTFGQVLDELDKQGVKIAPTFAFIDPFGFSGLPMQLIARLLNCNKCEVFVTFMAGFVKRFLDELREPVLTELFGTEEWKKARDIGDPTEKEKFLLSLYERQLQALGGAPYVRSFGMIGEQKQIIYYLVFATKHPKGLEVMKDAMWKVDRTGLYRFSDITGFQQSLLIDYENEPSWVPNAAKAVFLKFRGQAVSDNEVFDFIVTDTPFPKKKLILKYLENSSPPKIINVSDRKRAGSYPEGCIITFAK
jgi:three-Cys-motif partner protein